MKEIRRKKRCGVQTRFKTNQQCVYPLKNFKHCHKHKEHREHTGMDTQRRRSAHDI